MKIVLQSKSFWLKGWYPNPSVFWGLKQALAGRIQLLQRNMWEDIILTGLPAYIMTLVGCGNKRKYCQHIISHKYLKQYHITDMTLKWNSRIWKVLYYRTIEFCPNPRMSPWYHTSSDITSGYSLEIISCRQHSGLEGNERGRREYLAEAGS